MEIELGPVEYLRDGAERSLLAPDLRIDYGFIPGWEASLESKLTHGLTAGIPGTSLVESDALLKDVLREGSLQEKSGPSIATEFGILLPGINDQHGTGAVLNGIVSQRWDWGTTHLNAQIELIREQHADYFLDTIVEGPHDWPVRPVAEIFFESHVSLFRSGSALFGAIWQVQDNVAVDFGLRGARNQYPNSWRDPWRRHLCFWCDQGAPHPIRSRRCGICGDFTRSAVDLGPRWRIRGSGHWQSARFLTGLASTVDV
ncbi:MAG: hypothetical protein J2P48_13495, partial [Alphaproteobacteria bacterium]|nr:hypothetical protein [Alphaproteobacteria bacterium]